MRAGRFASPPSAGCAAGACACAGAAACPAGGIFWAGFAIAVNVVAGDDDGEGKVDDEVGRLIVVLGAGAGSCAELGVDCSDGVAGADSGSDNCCAVAAGDRSASISG